MRFDTNEEYVTDYVDHSALAVEVDKTRKLLESSQLENQQKLRLIADLTNQLAQTQQQVEDQRKEIEELNARLRKAYGDTAEIRNLYEEQHRNNKLLMEQWASRYGDQHKRIQALKRLLDGRLADEQDRVTLVTEIAKMERRNVYNDITSLMKDQKRFDR